MPKTFLLGLTALIISTSARSQTAAVGLVPCSASSGTITCTVNDSNSAAFQGVVAITPGTAVSAARSVGFVITAAGNVTFTLADTSTITLALVASPQLQTLPFAVTNVALGTGTAGSFWNLK